MVLVCDRAYSRGFPECVIVQGKSLRHRVQLGGDALQTLLRPRKANDRVTVFIVGAGQHYTHIAAAVDAARDGDTVRVQAGTYVNDFVSVAHDITIEGVGGIAHLIATRAPPNGKAILDESGNVTLKNLGFSGAAVPGGNGAGVRYEGGRLTVVNSLFRGNQDGLLSNLDPNGTIAIIGSEFSRNGAGDGYTHNLYVGGIKHLIVTGSYFHDVAVGHEIKSRAHRNDIENNRIADNLGTGSYSIDLPNGGRDIVRHNVIEKGASSQNKSIIHFGGEPGVYPASRLEVSHNLVLNDRAVAYLVDNAAAAPVTIKDNQTYGLVAGQLALGPASVSGNTALASEPALDRTSPLQIPDGPRRRKTEWPSRCGLRSVVR